MNDEITRCARQQSNYIFITSEDKSLSQNAFPDIISAAFKFQIPQEHKFNPETRIGIQG